MKIMKYIFTLLMNIFFAHSIFAASISYWNGIDSDTSWFNEESTTFHLYNAAQLKGLADIVNNNTSNFEDKVIYLESDIDLGNYPWEPIGYGYYQPRYFCGTFNGNEHTIKNLLISTTKLTGTYYATGFFGMTQGSEFLNINIEGKIVHNDAQKDIGESLGGLVGNATNGKIINVRSNIDISFSQDNPWGGSLPLATFIGFVAGRASEISKVYSEGTLTFTNCGVNSNYVGGIAGYVSTIEECCSNVNMTIPNGHLYDNHPSIGGIAGALVGTVASVKNSIFKGSISVYSYNGGDWCFMGGIFGDAIVGQALLEEVISVPSYFSTGIQYARLVGNISTSVQNVYYADTYAGTLDNCGESVSEEYLKSGTPLEGFDSQIWEFAQGELPQLKSLKPVMKYTLSYIVDGAIYKEYQLKEGDIITPEPDPTKDGYNFSGWSWIPSKMPAEDVTINGTFIAKKYKLTYIVDDEVYKIYEVAYESPITPEDQPTKEGYTFSGWSYIPSKMPNEDVTVTGTFSINSYTLTYMIGDEVYKKVEYEYGSTITPEPQPEGDYTSFEWMELPETMPAHDVIVYANYTSGIEEIIMNQKALRIYGSDGKLRKELQKGVNIILNSDGMTKKLVVK